ncbi:MAG TPA: glycosyltransferase family A protein, partial [Anaerolineales bacterium]|nr:glycosyltransferase family A protein [Anaerolineales bacterium]
MPTKVLDLDFENIPAVIPLDGYQRLMVLVRVQGRPVERLFVPVHQNEIRGDELCRIILREAKWVFWDYWLRHLLSSPEPPQDGPLSATIAICTRDRPADLQRCLDALTRTHAEYEILVIDSCSTQPDTREVVQTFPTVRYIREDKPGLDRARNRALREAHHEFVAFIDDDALPDPHWASGLFKNFLDPHVGCVTGLTMPIELETKAQETFETYCTFSRGFEYKTFDWSLLHPIGAGRVGVGTNMALRRSALAEVGFFDEALDAGTPTCSGGETDMFSRLLAGGYQIIYDPSALNWHRHRRTWDELRRTIYGYGVGVYAFWTRKILVDREG